MTARRIVGGLLLAVLAAGLRHVGTRSAAAPAAKGAPAAAAPERLALQGVASCAASGCHHGNGARGQKGSEYTTWMIHDRHARAYEVLLSERSRRIERNYRNLKDLAQAHPEQSPLCLSCHVQPQVDTWPRGPRFALRDGVGCESCHGPAARWLGPHQTWNTLKAEDRRRAYGENGMTWLDDLQTRAGVCVTCHVGSGAADVNHDLIAAGHPRLLFEYAAYLEHLPRHWDARAEKARLPDFEGRAWAVGQVVSAQAALQLLAARAQPAKKPWPEFAEYDCFACHHDLRQPSRRQQRGFGGQAPGLLPWASWPYALLPRALALQPGEDPTAIRSNLERLREEMHRPYPVAEPVVQRARLLAELLDRWLEQSRPAAYGDPDRLRAQLDAVQADERAADWDTAAQRYLALEALARALRDRQPDARDAAFLEAQRQRGKRLQFPAGFASPNE